MFNLRAYMDPDRFDEVTRVLHAHEGARHIVLSGTTMDTNVSLITAELDDAVADAVIEELTALGVRADDLSIARVQVVRPMTQEGYSIELESQTDTLVWSEVTDEAVDNIGLRPSYLAYMAVAGVIAAFGVIDRSAVLIVGAMAVSPDLLPLTAASVGIVARRGWLFGRAIGTLLPGLATAVLTAWLVTLALGGDGSGPRGRRHLVGRRLQPRRCLSDDRLRGRRGRGGRHAELRDARELRRRRRHLRDHHPGGGLHRRRRGPRRVARRGRRARRAGGEPRRPAHCGDGDAGYPELDFFHR